VANDKAEFWTTEQVAEHLGITVKDVYESARANRFPGSLGTQRGRRKLYRSDLILAGPQEPKTTSDPVEAILWTVQGIEAKLADLVTTAKTAGVENGRIVDILNRIAEAVSPQLSTEPPTEEEE
jgi:hypothetical protein